MKNNQLLSVRSNCTFALDYVSGKLQPQTEVILITSSPKYTLNKKQDAFTKELEVSEYRFISSLDGINQLIGELQLLVTNMNSVEQLSGSFNTIIQASKQAKETK